MTDHPKTINPPTDPAGQSLAGAHCSPARWSARLIFAWYDLWIGMFWDSNKRRLYVMPIPCVGVVFEFPRPENARGELPPASGSHQPKTL